MSARASFEWVKRAVSFASFASFAWLAACSEEVGDPDGGSAGTGGSGASSSGGGGGEIDLTVEGAPLEVAVATEGTTFVSLDPPASLGTDPSLWSDDAWGLAFTGYRVQTNGGVSGPGSGGAFGPLAAPQFLSDEPPDVPFLIEDRFGGAFLDWYDYDGESHALYSRYHVHGVRRGDELYKIQILGYYGEIEGAPVSAIFSLRYAPVSSAGVGPVVTIGDLDGTAGGLAAPPDAPAECLRLSTGERVMLSPADALTSDAWDLCFRRDAISVNGGDAGPAGAVAVDLMRDQIATETLDAMKEKTAASESAAFDAVSSATLDDPSLGWIGDGVVTAFSGQWASLEAPPVPANATWWVVGPDGSSGAMVAFIAFEGASAETPGTVQMRIKAMR